MKKGAKMWLMLAEEDYKDMRIMIKENRYRGAVFFAQQAVEKIIKALIIEDKNLAPKKTHNIEILLKDAGLDKNEIKDIDVNKLTLAYTRVRYSDLSTVHYNTKEKAGKVLEIAQKTYLWVKTKLKSN